MSSTMEYRALLNKAKGKQEMLSKMKAENEQKYIVLEARQKAIDLAQALIQEVAQQTQSLLTFQLKDIVQLALNTCFPMTFEFNANFVAKRGKTECDLVLVKDGYEVNPMDASGGGVVDILSLGLRLAAWSLGNTRNTIILDEGMKWLSRDLQPRAGEILQELSKKLNLQFIMVSHSSDLIASSDKVYEISQKNGVSKATEV